MKNQIVTIHRNEPRTSSWVLKNGFDVDHRALTRLVKKYKSEFQEFGIVVTGLQQFSNGAGPPVKHFLLNEEQTYFLGTLLPNNEAVRKFKLILVKNFSIAKTALLQKAIHQQSPEWIALRQTGKLTHRTKTDTIKDFVGYAMSQGSTSADRYYMAIARMENQALFLLEQKFKNLRDILNLDQLATIKVADAIVFKAIKDGMDAGLHYKDIYQLAKKRVESLADLHGKTFIPVSQQLRLEA